MQTVRLSRLLAAAGLLTVLAIALATGWSAGATIRWVDDSYGGDNPGLNQWTTVQKAINNATDGDTIYIFAGTYAESVIVNKTLNVQGESRNSTIVDPLIGSALSIQANNVNLSSFTVVGALYGVTISSPYVNLVIDSLTFEQNTRGLNTNLVTNVTVSASYFGNHSGFSNAGVYASRGANVTSKNNTFFQNYYAVYYDRVVTGIVRDGEASGNRFGGYFSSARGTVVDRNHVGNSSASGYGFYFVDDHNSTVSSNRIDNITTYGLAITNSFSMEILQNDISDCGSNFYLSPGNDLSGRYYGHSIATSNLFDGKPAYYYKNTTNVSVPSGAGWLGVFNVTNLTVAAQNITNELYGVWLVSVANVRLAGLNFSNARVGINGNGVYGYNVTNAVFWGINLTSRGVAAYVISSTAVSIENSSVAGNRSLPAYYFGLLYINTVPGLRVLNNTVTYGSGGYIYYSDYALLANNAFTDGYFGFSLGYGAYPRLFSNTFNNTSSPLTPYGFDPSHYSWTLPVNNTWDGRAVRAFVNTTTATVSANYAWLLLTNVSNVTVYSYSVNNGSGYAGVIAYSSNVSIGNLTQNGSSSGFYITYSSFVGIWNSWTNSSSQPFYIRSSSDVTIANGSWLNVDYEGFGVDSSPRVTVRNVTFAGLYASYFFEAYYSSELLVDNVTSTHTYQFAYMEGMGFSTVNRIDASIGGPAFTAGYAFYLYNVTDLNFTNSRYRDFQGGIYVDYANWKLRVFNVTFSNLTDQGIFSKDSSSGNFSVLQSRFEALTGAAVPAAYGLYFQDLQDRLLLSGLNLSGFETGIFVDPMTNVTVTGSQINNTTTGIFLTSVTDSAVTSNTLRDIGFVAIRVSASANVTVSGNTVVNGGQIAIDLDSSTACTVSSNTVQGGQVGIRAAGGYGHLVSGNTANGTTDAGIFVTFGHYSSTFNSNTLTNGYQGIFLDSVQFLTLDSNVMAGNEYNFRINAYWIGYFHHRINATNTVDGKPVYFIVNGSGGIVPTTAGLVILANTTNYLVSGSTIAHNYHGVLLYESSGITVLNVTVATSYYAVETLYTINSSIRNSRFDGGYYGLLIEYATNFLLQGNSVNGSNYGAYLQGGRNVTLDNTSLNASLYTGLGVWSTDASNLTGNRITNTTYGGVDIGYSSGITFYSNNITGNRYSFNMNGYDIAHFAHTLPPNNTVDGFQIFYRINTSDVAAPPNASVVVFANITNGTVAGLRLNNTGAGIILYGSRSINISSLVLANGNAAIRVLGSQNVSIWNISSDLSDYYYMSSVAEAWYGSSNVSVVNSTLSQVGSVVYAYYASNLVIRNIRLGDIANYSSAGMALQAYGQVDNVTIDLVNFSYSSYGFYAYGFGGTEKVSNVTVSNSSFGYYTYAPVYVASAYAENFSFFHNNFDMTYAMYGNMQPNDPYNVTRWHRAYPVGGNYWSNWTSPDDYGGASQGLGGGDGVVDLSFDGPYTWDRYPLVDPWPPRTRLVSPANLSAILPGTVLDFYVPLYFDAVTYSVNNGSSSTFAVPFNISTSGWAEGVYRVWVNGSDATGAADSQFFVFAIDTTAPSISAASPAPGGLYATGTQLNFTITDEHLSTNATWDAGFGQVPFPSPWNVSTVGWADGWWNVTVHAWDTAGNGASGTFNYALDGNAPTIALNSPSNNSVIASGTTIDLSIADAFFNNTSWSTGGPWTGFTSPFDVSTTGWGDGLTTLVVAAFDQLGRQTVRSYVFTLDSTAPSITLNTPSNGSIIQAGTSLDFSVGDANFQNSSWSNGGPWFSFNSPFDINTGGWADGAVTVTVRAFDQAGNSRTSTFDFSVDTTAPSITLGSPVNNSLIAAGSTIDFAISDAHTFSASWNNGNGSTPFSSPFDVVTTGWADGVVTVVVTATDSAGNGRTASYSFDVDGELPAITLNTPANNSYVPAGRSLDLSLAEAHPGTVTWNNGSGAVGLSSPYDVPTTGWPDGSVNVTVVATDAVGNARTVVFHFTMDSTLPSVSLVSPANNSVFQAGTTIDFAVSDTNLNTVFWVQGNQTLASPYDVDTSGWADGANVLSVTATDLAGNSRTLVIAIEIDNTAPALLLNQPTNGSTFGAGTLVDFSITDLHSLSATWDNGSGTTNLTAPFDIDTTGWTDGNYTVAIVATDVAGNSATASFDFTIDNAFPAVILNTPSNNSVIPSGTVLDFDVVDADLNNVTYDTGSGSANFSAPYDLDTTGFSEGPLNVTVRADDNSSHIVIVVFRFTIDDTDPLLSLTGPANNSVLSAGSTIDLSVTEVNLDYAAYDNGNGTQLLPAPFDIDTSGWSDGGVDVSVTVYDLAGHSAAATFHFTMDSTAPAISMGSPSNNSVLSPGATLDFSITDVHSFNATWGNGSGPFSFSSPFDVATSGWADGAVTVTVSATDIAGNLRVASFAFTIDSIAPSIALTAPSNASVIPAGTTLDFALSDVHTFNATWSNGSGGPFALASPFDVSTAGWPDGATTVTLSATDVAGNARTRAFVFTLDSTRPSIALVAPSNNSAIAAGTTLDFTVSDANLQNATWNNGSGALPLVSPFNVDTTAWADGPIDVEIVALDLAGNSRAVSFHFEMDSTPPTVTLVAPANNSVIGAGTMIDLNITDLHGVASASWNNGSGPVALPSPFDINTSAWADGDHNLTIVATDGVGNIAPPLVIHFFVDRTPPSIVLEAPSAGAVIRPGTTLDFAVTDTYGLGNVSWNNGSGLVGFVAPFTVNTTSWIDGAVNVTVTATDAFGNLRASVFAFTFDGTAPAVSLVSPANNSVVTAGTLIDTEIVELHLVSATWNNGSGPVSLTSPFNIPTTGWADGAYTLTVNATDEAGNFASAWFRVTIDTTSPNITLVAPANNSVIAGGTVLDLSIVELNLNNASWSNGSAWAALTSPFDISTAGWLDGSVTVSLSATDLAGNARTSSFRFTMDSTYPTLLLASPANGSVIAPGATLDFDAADANLANVSWNNGSGPNALPDPYDLSTASWPEGNRNITVIAVDLAGNARTLIFFFTFDGTPPTVTLVTPANNTIILAGTVIDLTVSDLHLDEVTWDNSSGTNTLTSPFNIATTGWPDGAYNITIIATDLAGNVRYVVLRYTFDTTPPTITLLSPSNNSFVRAGTTLDLLITDLTALSVTWDNTSGPNTILSPYDVNTAGWGDGSVDLTVVATDAVGNSRTRVFHFTFDSTLPAITLLTPTNNSVIRPGVAINFSITDTNFDTATWDNGGGAAGFATQWSISTTGWADGPYNVIVDATDLAGNARTRVFRFTIDSVLPAVTLNTPSNNSYIAAGTVINLTISDVNLATATWDDGTGAQTFTTAWNISTTGWSEGSINITVSAADGAGNSRTRIFHFTIDSTLPALSLLSPTNNSYFGAGMLINFSLSDTNLDAATWDNGGGAQSFVTQWNISTTGWSDASYNITVTVTDLAGNSRTRIYRFTVDSTPPAVSLTSPGNNSYVDAGTAVALAISDTNFNTATWDTGSGPQSFVTQWTISTTAYADGSYNFTVVARDLAGNAAFRVYRVWIDSTAPTIAPGGSTPANGSYFNGGRTLQFDIVEAHLLSATWNNGTSGNVSFSAPFQVDTAGWQDGVFDLALRAADRAGHQAYSVYRFTVDLTAPSIALVSPANDSYVDAGTTVTLTIVDTNLNTATWDNGGGTTNFAAQWTIATAGWSDASYNITVTVTDLAGNSRSRVYHIWIDSTAPTVSLNAATPQNGSYFDSGVVLVFDVIEAHILSSTWNNGTSGNVSFTAPFQVSTALWPDGGYNLTVRVTDRALHQAYFVYRFTLDSVAPSIANVSWEGGYFEAGWLLNGTYSDSNPLWWSHQVDLLPPQNGSSNGYQVDTAGLADGAHSVRVQVGDRAAHVSVRVFLITIDSDPPQIQNVLPADGSFFQPGTLITFTVLDNNTANVTWQRNAGGFLPANGTGGLRSINTNTWGDGNWTVRIIASDLAGHVTSVTVTLVTDATPPSMPPALALNQSYFEDLDVPLDATSAQDGGNPLPDASFIWAFTDRLGPLALGPLVGRQVTYSGWTQPGDFEYTLTITDLAGNRANRTYGVHIDDTTPPEIRLSVPASADEDTPVLLDGSQTTDNDPTFLANDPSCAGGRFAVRASDGTTVTIVLVGVGGPFPTACLAPSHTFSEPGSYAITFNVTDKSGNPNSTSWPITVLDKSPPEVSGFVLPAVVNEGVTLSLDATATTDNDPANLSLVNYTWTIRRIGGALATRYGGLANFTFIDPGDYLVNLTARDVSGNRNSTILPMRVNDIPVLGNSPPTSLTLPENMDFRLAITDADSGDSFNVTNVAPAGIAVGNDSLTGQPRLTWAPSSYGPFTITLTLSDGFAWVNYSFNITIRVSPTNNPPPVWESTPLGELRESITYSYDANARDPAGDTLFHGLTVGPAGMSIDSVTGIVSWYHTLSVTSSDQVFDVHIYAWDGANYIWQNYTVRLRATPNIAPTIEAAGAWSTVTVEEGASFTLSLASPRIIDPDDTLLNITATSLDTDKVSVEVIYVGGTPSLRITGVSRGSAVITLRVADPSQAAAVRDISVTVAPRATTPPGGGESGIGGLIPLIGLGVAGAGAAGFFIVMRGRKQRKEEVPAAAAAVQAVAAPTLAAEAGTVVLTAESAAAAALVAAAAAAAPEKKITYTIEGLFVIYKDGRLLYSKTDMGQAKFEDPELVSSMFTAVQSFIKDSFSSEGELNKMGYGDNQIIIERGRSVFTAAIVYGEPDQEFHDAMKGAIENIELSYAGLIEAWDGMMDTFADMDQKLAAVIALSAGITRREVQLATTKQEVLMLSELEFFQGFVRLKCGIKNNTPSVITKATVDIEYNEDVLRLARVEPAAYRTAGAKVLLGVLNPGEKSSVAYYFDPQICTESQIDGVCRYRDASGVLHTVAMKTRKAEVVCPLFFTKEHANTAMLKRLVEAELSEKDSKVFEIQKIPPYIKHKDVFDLIKSVVNAHDVQMVREFTKFNPFHGEAWFFGETKVKGYKIVIRATVIEETNAIEFFAASTNMKAITGLLAEFNHTLNSMVIEKYSDLKIAQIFDSETKAEIEKKSLMSNMSSAELEGAETEQGGDVSSAPAEPAPPQARPENKEGREIPEPEKEPKNGNDKPGEGGGQAG